MASGPPPETPQGASNVNDLLDLLQAKREAGALCRSLGFSPAATFDALLGFTLFAERVKKLGGPTFRLSVGVINEGGRFGLEFRAERDGGPPIEEQVRRSLETLLPLMDTVNLGNWHSKSVITAVKWAKPRPPL